MLANVHDILTAKGEALKQPLAFGPYAGHTLSEVPEDYFHRLADLMGIDVAEFKAKAATITEASPANLLTRDISEFMFPYQRKYVEHMAGRRAGLLIGGIGIGKTFIGAEMMHSRWQPGMKAVVFTRLNNVDDWEECLRSHYPNFTFVMATGSTDEKLTMLRLPRDVYILNHEAVLRPEVTRFIAKMEPDWCIIDESHRIKNASAKMTKAFIRMSAAIPNRLAMTGTPITGRELDVFPQIQFCDRGQRFGSSFSRFKKEYFESDFKGWSWELREGARVEFERKLAELVYIIPREEALPYLPPKEFKTVEVPLKGEALKTYKDYQDRALVVLGEETEIVTHKVVEILRLIQVAGGGVNKYRFKEQPKLKELSTIIDQADCPIAIVARFRHEMDAIEELLKRKKLKFGSIRGSVKTATRREIKRDFRDGKLDAILLQEQAGAEGINGLQYHCHLMVFYSRSHNWEKRDQMEGRISRKDQEEQCTYIDLLAVFPDGRPTIDHAVMKCLKEKETRINQVIENVRRILAA